MEVDLEQFYDERNMQVPGMASLFTAVDDQSKEKKNY